MKTKTMFTRYGIACLSFLLALGSCQDHITDEPNPRQVESASSALDGDADTGNYEHLTLSITAEDLDKDQLKANFDQINRPEVDGKDYSFEVSAKLNLTPGNTYEVYLVLVQEGVKESMHRQRLTFKVLDPSDPQAKGRKNVLYYSGPVSLPTGRSFRDGTWYAMALFHHQLSGIYNDAQGGSNQNRVVYGRRTVDPNTQGGVEDNSTSSSASVSYSDDNNDQTRKNEYYVINRIPYISQWYQLTLPEQEDPKGEAHRLAMGLVFKPQGVLLHYDLGVNVLESLELRRYGLYTNALKFSGEYDTNVDNLYSRFEARDKTTGIGLPEWKEDPHRQRLAKLYWEATPSLLSSSGVQEFPWDLPTISQTGFVDMQQGAYPREVQTEASFCDIRVRGWQDTDNRAWYFWTLSESKIPRRSIIFWGMPVKDTPAKPFTYFWVGAYDNKAYINRYQNANFSPQVRLDEQLEKVRKHREQIEKWEEIVKKGKEKGQNTSQAEATIQEYYLNTAKPDYDKYSADSITYYDQIQPAYIKDINETTQPILVLHQTNATFGGNRERKIHHIRTMLTSDLMITELIYKTEDGHNYSAVELFNPTYAPLNLRDYALVRLADAGGKMLYRKADGTTTEQIGEAELYQLSSLGDEVKANLNGSQSPSVLIGSPTSTAAWNVSRGEYKGQSWYVWSLINGEMPIYQHQTVVLGAKGYQDNKPNLSSKEWYTPLKSKMEDMQGSKYVLRYFAAPTSADTFFNLDFAEGFALLKREASGWRVIDATAPIGSEHYAFAGTYAGYKAQLDGLQNKTEYCMHRKNQVKFPFLPPYRTKRVGTEWSDDWVLKTDVREATPGDRLVNGGSPRLSQRYPYWYLRRTPMDKTYTTYKQNEPDKTN